MQNKNTLDKSELAILQSLSLSLEEQHKTIEKGRPLLPVDTVFFTKSLLLNHLYQFIKNGLININMIFIE